MEFKLGINIKASEIVMVNAKGASHIPLLECAVLCDRAIEEVVKFATTFPKCYVLPLYTKEVEDAPDCNCLAEYDHVLRPLYIGHLKPVKEAAVKIVTAYFGNSDWCLIHDDIPERL
jgi:hypothetical protein